MKETGIIMSGDHPKLILDGAKTQTRRVITPQPTIYTSGSNISSLNWRVKPSETIIQVGCHSLVPIQETILSHCPYGQVGDRLWARETHYLDTWGQGNKRAIFKDGGELFETGQYIPNFCKVDKLKWRPSIHMPRWASRILLEITELRVERVQEIRSGDCRAEGVLPDDGDSGVGQEAISLDRRFRQLWDSLNAKRGYGWEVNPWVFVIGFRRIE